MKLSKCILLAAVAVSASFASANTSCQNAANPALTKNPAEAQRTADIWTRSATGNTEKPEVKATAAVR